MAFFKDRLAVAIGKNGETKKLLEDQTGTNITINSKTGEYHITAKKDFPISIENPEFQDPSIRVYTAQSILNAINYGFNPQKALKLLDAENIFELINLEQIVGHSERKLRRMKGRLIGDQGKIRQDIEKYSKVNLSIYGKYLALIGEFDSIKIAKKAINMILQGAPHKTVINYLHEEYQKKKQQEFTEMWKPTL
ncbi:MAG: KH domain-containing protein [Candidatus Lokiarchaeota archaeon]|nr:KH domain-containing protein [Candidatus Harpocratesius repetitus]